MKSLTRFILITLMGISLISCTQRNSSSENTGGNLQFTPIPSANFTYTEPTPEVPCNADGVHVTITRIAPAVGIDPVINQSIVFGITASGCSEYRVTPVNGTNLDPIDFTASNVMIPVVTSYASAQSNIQQMFIVQGINSAGYMEHTKTVVSDTFSVIDNSTPPEPEVPDNFACTVSPLENSSVMIPVDSDWRPLAAAPVFSLDINTNGVAARVVSITGPPIYQMVIPLNLNTATYNTSHLVATRVEAYGYVPIRVEVEAEINSSEKRSCETLVSIIPYPQGPPPPPPEAPSCTITASKSSIILGEDITVSLVPTGLVDSATLNGTEVAASGGEITYTPSGLGTHEINGFVSGEGGMGFCSSTYEITRPMGLRAQFYDFGGTYHLPNYDNLTPVAEKSVDNINIPRMSCHSRYPHFTQFNFQQYYGARYTGYIKAPTAGTYHFRTYSDDGVMVYINGQAVVSHNNLHAPSYKTGSIYLPAGEHSFKLDWFQGPCSLVANQLSWKKPGDNSYTIVPKSAFAHE